MNNEPVMRGGNALCDLQGIIHGLTHGDGACTQARPQVPALEQFRDDVRHRAFKTDVVDGENVGMVQRGGGARFLLETVPVVRIVAGSGADKLQRHVAPQPFVPRAKDFAHCSGADLFEDPIMPHELANHKRIHDPQRCMAC